jgi:hypothetical protein
MKKKPNLFEYRDPVPIQLIHFEVQFLNVHQYQLQNFNINKT